MANRHQQESLTALYQSIKYCEELGLPCNDIYSALGHLESELKRDREANKQELEKIDGILWADDADLVTIYPKNPDTN